MLQLLQRIAKQKSNLKTENFTSGDTVNVFVRVKEGEKERTQVFAGVVTKIQGSGTSRSFTVRKISNGVGVERCFPFASPALEKVEVVSFGKVRRSKLYYLRDLKGKKARIEFDLATDADQSPEVVQQAAAKIEKAEAAKAAKAASKSAEEKK